MARDPGPGFMASARGDRPAVREREANGGKGTRKKKEMWKEDEPGRLEEWLSFLPSALVCLFSWNDDCGGRGKKKNKKKRKKRAR